jgi:hypothetical protein
MQLLVLQQPDVQMGRKHPLRAALRDWRRRSTDAYRTSPDLAQQTLKRIVGADTTPVLLGKCVIGQRLLDPASASSAARVRRDARSLSITRMALSRAAATSWIALSIAAISRTLVDATRLKMLRYQ